MKHDLKISVRKKPSEGSLVFCRKVNMRERILRWLLGAKTRMTFIVAGDSIETVAVRELPEGGDQDELS